MTTEERLVILQSGQENKSKLQELLAPRPPKPREEAKLPAP